MNIKHYENKGKRLVDRSKDNSYLKNIRDYYLHIGAGALALLGVGYLTMKFFTGKEDKDIEDNLDELVEDLDPQNPIHKESIENMQKAKELSHDEDHAKLINYKNVKGKNKIVNHVKGNLYAARLCEEPKYCLEEHWLTSNENERQENFNERCRENAGNPIPTDEYQELFSQLFNPLDDKTKSKIPIELIPVEGVVGEYGEPITLRNIKYKGVKILSLSYNYEFNPIKFINLNDIAKLENPEKYDCDLPASVFCSSGLNIIISNTLDDFVKASNGRFYTMFNSHHIKDSDFTEKGFNFGKCLFGDLIIIYKK